MRHLAPFRHALLVIDTIVFDVPAELTAMRRAAGETREWHQAPGHLVDGDAEELRRLLQAVLSAWVDFRVLFSPGDHALRADHDEFTTFFSTSPGWTARVEQALGDGGVKVYEAAKVRDRRTEEAP